MNCDTCLQNCDPLITDKCVKYTGPDIPLLGICKGDSLFEVEAILIEKLTALADGSGIALPDITLDCLFVSNLLGSKTKTIENLVQALLTGECNLDARITALASQVNTPFSFNTSCLTGNLSTRDLILQAVINLLCDVNTRLTIVETNYVKQSDLCTQVAACIASSSSTQYKDRMVPYAPIPYIGPLSNFDNTGKGIVSAGFEKVYLMNGLNGTQDWRGRSPIGAIQNVPGATLDSAVNPALPANSAYNYVVNQKYGASTETLTVLQMPAHTHGVNDPKHEHFTIDKTASGTKGASTTQPVSWSSNRANGNQDYDLCVVNGTADTGPTNTVATGITIGTSGANQAHNTLHPVIGTYFIIYLP